MLGRGDLHRMAEVCNAIGNDVSDDSGFVPIRDLLARFNSRLLLRPLLVEGMLASTSDASAGNGNERSRWAILVDSDTYQVGEDAIATESTATPLPVRFRNTIAHELVHSLAFRAPEFGVRLKVSPDDAETLSEVVISIERETEDLSPRLLCPEKALSKLLQGKKEQCSADEFVNLARRLGISRQVLVNRLRMLHPTEPNGFRHSNGLRDIGIGLAEWNNWRGAVLKGWPLFTNFSRNIVPAFFFKLSRQNGLLAQDVWHDDSFAMCGGAMKVVDMVTNAGTPSAPDSGKLKVRLSFEECDRNGGAEFLYTVHAHD